MQKLWEIAQQLKIRPKSKVQIDAAIFFYCVCVCAKAVFSLRLPFDSQNKLQQKFPFASCI